MSAFTITGIIVTAVCALIIGVFVVLVTKKRD